MKRIDETDCKRIEVVLLRRLVDKVAQEIVQRQHGVEFLLDEFGQLAAKDRPRLTSPSRALVGLDRIVGELDFPSSVVIITRILLEEPFEININLVVS